MRIQLTQQDIANGRRAACNACPVALAISRATGEQWEVGNSSAWCVGSCASARIYLSSDTMTFIDAFDHGRSVAQFEFELPI